MGEHSKISWTDATFNPWWGCQKVSEGCTYCYAERDAKRFSDSDLWGKDTPRRFFGRKHWAQPEEWNKKARKEGKRIKVFCGSMCDVFEARPDLSEQRKRLWTLIEDTEHLEWLLLTKRPMNIVNMIPDDWKWDDMPDNVWFGTTVEDQERATRLVYISEMKNWTNQIFISVEPMLGPVIIPESLWTVPKWIIVGGESGAGARAMSPQWAFNLLLAAHAHGVPAFMKQMGGYPNKRDDINFFPTYLRVQQFPAGLE